MNSTANSPDFVIVELSGPLLLAFSTDWALFAVLTVQLYLYYQAFPNDRVFTKGLVYTVYCISLIQVVFTTIDAFNTFGYGFGDPSALETTEFAWLVAPVIGGIVAFVVQCFYAFRLYQLSRSWIVPSGIVLGALGACITGIIEGITGRQSPRLNLAKLGVNLSTEFAVTTALCLVGTALIDITIAACMTYYLTKSDTGFRRTHALATKFIRLSIETGVITALVAILTLALFFGLPGKAYYVVPGNSISTAYANTLFAALNSRFQILNGRADVSTSDILVSIPSNVRSPVVSVTRERFSDGPNSLYMVQAIEVKKMNGSRSATAV
ncbi:hypothetical protein B0H16DRAFT_1821674 [Mycena metata]|uniref:DUF6534 domain-containing protein n=1 Tax=Mycena metata TaxID=1033252 RepID=A0AAD7J8B7_9AGAR|nr:hypothetical protein B0H16DRAFT_1821674 [Mycena metata]